MVDASALLNIEYGIIGTLLFEPGCAGECVAKLSPSHFSSESARKIFEAISALHFEGAPIDPVTVAHRVGRSHEDSVREMLSHATAKSNLDYYCDLLIEQGKLRRLQTEAMALVSAETLQDAGGALDKLNGLMVTRKSVQIVSSLQAAEEFFRSQDAPAPEFLKWGIGELDKALFTELGDFVVVGGYPSAGKTLLSLQFAVSMAAQNPVGYFSLETSPKKLIDRLMSHLSKVPLAKIKKRDLNDADCAALADAGSRLSSLPIDFVDAGGMTVRDIQAVALNRHYKIVLVDYLQLVVDHGKGRYEQVTNISQGLHTLARSNEMTVIALAQLRRPEKDKGKPKPPSMADFRESGQIEQDADVAMLLWPSDPNDNRSRRVLKVAKNKEGERLKLELEFDGATQTMTVAVPTKGEQYRKVQREIRQASREVAQIRIAEVAGDDPTVPF